MKKFKSGFVAILGRANVGKSTLMNSLIGQKLSIVTPKAQTTRFRIQGVLNIEGGQIVFVDTPGMLKPKNKLDEYMVDVIEETMTEMDLVMMMVDASAGIGPGDEFMATRLPAHKKKILLLNKIDLITEERLKELMEEAKGLGDFDEILAVSAMIPETVLGLIPKILDYLPEGPAYYPEDQWTNISEKLLVSELIREKALLYLDQEIPHGITVLIDEFEDDEDLLRLHATIVVERESHKGIVIGKGGRKLKGIGKHSRVELEEVFGKKVFLELFVKVKEKWRNSAHYLEDYGYRK